MDINNEPVNDQQEAQKNSEDKDDDNSCFDGGGSELAKYKDFEIVVEDDRNFILKHKEDLEPAVQITMRQDDHGVQWIGLPECLKEQLNAFSAEDVEMYPGTLLKTILDQLHYPKEELKDSEEVKK